MSITALRCTPVRFGAVHVTVTGPISNSTEVLRALLLAAQKLDAPKDGPDQQPVKAGSPTDVFGRTEVQAVNGPKSFNEIFAAHDANQPIPHATEYKLFPVKGKSTPASDREILTALDAIKTPLAEVLANTHPFRLYHQNIWLELNAILL